MTIIAAMFQISEDPGLPVGFKNVEKFDLFEAFFEAFFKYFAKM